MINYFPETLSVSLAAERELPCPTLTSSRASGKVVVYLAELPGGETVPTETFTAQ